MRRYYEIHFTGYWPVGAVAIVQASSPAMALERFQSELRREHPELWKKPENQAMKPTDVIELSFLDNPVKILLDGEY